MLSADEYFQILGLDARSGATEADVIKAYRKMTMRFPLEIYPEKEEFLKTARQAHDVLVDMFRRPTAIPHQGLIHEFDSFKEMVHIYKMRCIGIHDEVKLAHQRFKNEAGWLRSCFTSADQKKAESNLYEILKSPVHRHIVATFNELDANLMAEAVRYVGSPSQKAYYTRLSDTREMIRTQDNLIDNWLAVIRGAKGIRLKEPQMQ